MESSVLRLHAYCSIGPHLVFAVLSLIYDTRAWYDTVAALAIVLPISALVIYLDFRLNLRGAVHCACIILGVIGYGFDLLPGLFQKYNGIRWRQARSITPVTQHRLESVILIRIFKCSHGNNKCFQRFSF